MLKVTDSFLFYRSRHLTCTPKLLSAPFISTKVGVPDKVLSSTSKKIQVGRPHVLAASTNCLTCQLLQVMLKIVDRSIVKGKPTTAY